MARRNPLARALRRTGSAFVTVALAGCGYDTDIYGMYFPSWVVAPVIGGLAAGALLAALGRGAAARYLGNRTLLFLSLTVILSVGFWWVAFRD
jgi:hypothetical protein